MNAFLAQKRRMLIVAATTVSLNTRSINNTEPENSEGESEND